MSWKLANDLFMAQFEAQRVISLRMLVLAQGGATAQREAEKMVTEKIGASIEAAATLAAGGSPSKVLRRYRTIMKANGKRLAKRSR